MSDAEHPGHTGDDPGISIEDEDFVDKRVKKRILDSRDQVNSAEDILFTEPVVNPDVSVPYHKRVVAWGNTVRRYMRDIEVLLNRLPIQSADHYMRDVELGDVDLVPPNKGGYQWQLVAEDSIDDEDLRRRLGLPPHAELPQVETREFYGLQSIIEREPVMNTSWLVTIDDTGAPPTHEHMTLHTQRPVPKWIYENAIRAADRFLHDAGIGVEIEAQPHRSEEPGL